MLSDTAPDAEEVQLELLREKTPSERATMALRYSSEVIALPNARSLVVIRSLRNGQVGYKFIDLHYGGELADAHLHSRVSPLVFRCRSLLRESSTRDPRGAYCECRKPARSIDQSDLPGFRFHAG